MLPQSTLLGAQLARVFSGEETLTERDMVLANSEGEAISVDCVFRPMQPAGATGPVESVLVEMWHLERHKQLERDNHLISQNETAREVLRGLAHEIKNPLGGLRGAAQLLEHELQDEALKEYTQVIVREADRLRNLVDRMLGPHRVPRFASLNVHEVTERVYRLVLADAPAGVRIERDYDPSIPPVYADNELLIQALLNVARNALQAVADQGWVCLRTRVHRHLNIGNRHHRLVIGIDVLDDGPGIPADIEERIFYPLVSGRSDGTGLGLSIAQSIVNQHGGLIEYRRRRSDPSTHTEFSILLPVRSDQEHAEVKS